MLNMGIKDSWVNGYDRFICLKDGEYTIAAHTIFRNENSITIKVNGTVVSYQHHHNDGSGPHQNADFSFNYQFKRGDYMQMVGEVHGNEYSHFTILKTKRN